MEKLRLRCPVCTKLYEVNEADIKSHSPQFDCLSCATRFSFQYAEPGSNLQPIKTFVVGQFVGGPENGPKADTQVLSKTCPKCGAINDSQTAKKTDECYSCHVIFSRIEELPLDPTLKAQPSLVRKWKNLVLNFNNKELHEDFLNSCHQLDALRFAILKYEELKSAQGGTDEISERMIFKAHGLLKVTLSSKAEAPAGRQAWHKYILWVPLGLSLLMILMGFFNLGLRNLVGAGVSVMLLTFGLILFWKGRISLSDFH